VPMHPDLGRLNPTPEAASVSSRVWTMRRKIEAGAGQSSMMALISSISVSSVRSSSAPARRSTVHILTHDPICFLLGPAQLDPNPRRASWLGPVKTYERSAESYVWPRASPDASSAAQPAMATMLSRSRSDGIAQSTVGAHL
jgi:hypothetical protein